MVYLNQSAGNSIGAANTSVNNWIVLNRILDPSGVPSQILGSIKAEGSVYLLNQNGIIFGGSCQVNVASLLASSLNLFDPNIATSNTDFLQYGMGYKFQNTSLFANGILATQNPNAGPIILQTGAQVNGGNLGLILLAAPSVTNSGSISTTGGQAALIAGIGVDFGYLPDPSNGSPTLMPSGGTQVSITPSGHTNLLQFFNTGTIINAKGVNKTPVGHLTNSDFLNGSLTYAPGQVISVSIQYNNWLNVANPKTGQSRWPGALPPGAGRILLEDGNTLDVPVCQMWSCQSRPQFSR
jgi:filamentous hemagglutinin family protein